MEHSIRAEIEQFDFSTITLEIMFNSYLENGHLELEITDFDIIDGEHTDNRSVEEMAEEFFYSDNGQTEILDVYYRDIERR